MIGGLGHDRTAAIGYAHAKIILVGEHAVVYGQPALAMPLQALTVRAAILRAKGPLALECPIFAGPLREAPVELSGVATAFTATLDRLGMRRADLLLRLRSSVPPARGLGSSAASAAAVVRAVYESVGAAADARELRGLVDLAEDQVHGTASGVDSAGVLAEGPFLFRTGQQPEPVPAGAGAVLLIGDTGCSAETRTAVAEVRQRLDSRAQEVLGTMAELGDLTRFAEAALRAGDIPGLGRALDASQRALESLGVSHPLVHRLVQRARKAGALGAKLTGGGLGGAMIALAADDEAARSIAQALRDEGAVDTWRQPIAVGVQA